METPLASKKAPVTETGFFVIVPNFPDLEMGRDKNESTHAAEWPLYEEAR